MRILLATLMVVAIAASGLVAADKDDLFVGEDQDGNIVSFHVPAWGLDHGSTGTVQTFTCVANPQCSTGDHSYRSTFSHGFVVGGSYTGPASSVLLQTSGSPAARVFSCFFTNGSPQCFPGVGTFPPAGATFTHECVAALGNPVTGGPTCQVFHN